MNVPTKVLDFFRRKMKAPDPETIVGILVTMNVSDEQTLFIVLGADGAINRLGDSLDQLGEGDMYIGMTSPEIFKYMRRLVHPRMMKWVGNYGDPLPEGKICKLTVGFKHTDGSESLSNWRYGSKSQGPPPEIQRFIKAAIDYTNPWYTRQKRLVGKN